MTTHQSSYGSAFSNELAPSNMIASYNSEYLNYGHDARYYKTYHAKVTSGYPCRGSHSYAQCNQSQISQWLKNMDEDAMIVEFAILKDELGIDVLRNWVDNCKQKNGLLHVLTKSGKASVIKSLVTEHGFDVNVQRTSDGCTCLHLAVWDKNLVLVQQLQDQMSANPNIKNKYGEDVATMLSTATHSPLQLKNALQRAKSCDDVLSITQGDLWESATPVEVTMALNRIARFAHRKEYKDDVRLVELIDLCAQLFDTLDGDLVAVIAAAMVHMPVTTLLGKLDSLRWQRQRFESFTSNQLAKLATCLPRSNLCQFKPVYQVVADVASARLSEFALDPHDAAALCLVFGKACWYHHRFFRLIVAHILVVKEMCRLESKAVSDVIWSLGRVQMVDQSWTFTDEKLANALASRVVYFSDDEVANVLWALATLSVENEVLLRSLFERARTGWAAMAVSFTQSDVQNVSEFPPRQLQLLFAWQAYEQICPELLHEVAMVGYNQDESEMGLTNLSDIHSSISGLDDLGSIRELDELLRSMEF